MSSFYIDHPDLMINKSPDFKAFVPVLCQALPVDSEFNDALESTLTLLTQAIATTTDEVGLVDEQVNEFRNELLKTWADYSIESQRFALIAHGVHLITVDGITFQFVKTSMDHPRRQDLVIHAFSLAAFDNLKVEEGNQISAELLGEDCGVHYTMHKQDPNEADIKAISDMIESTEAPTFDDYLNIF